MCAAAGFDWLLMDGEHGPTTCARCWAPCKPSRRIRSHPVVRIPHGDAALDQAGARDRRHDAAGADGRECRAGRAPGARDALPAAGRARRRQRASRVRRAGARYPNYLHEANEQVCLLVQVETRAALEQVEAIAAVEGVDGVFIGPSDLSASMGHLGQPAHPEVRAAIDRAIRRDPGAGKAPGILCADEALARALPRAGRALRRRGCGQPRCSCAPPRRWQRASRAARGAAPAAGSVY